MMSVRFIVAFMLCLCVGTALAEVPDDQAVLENLRRVRVKQQGEEGAVRIQHFINQQNSEQCTPIQQARQRIKDINEAEEGTEEVSITAGHGELNVTDNHGTINSNISVQVIKQGEDKGCL